MMNEERAADDVLAATQQWNQQIIGEFRANKGALGRSFAGAPVLLLHISGAKSGIERVNPIMDLEEIGYAYVLASKAGANTDPDWFRNLVANPDGTVEIGAQMLRATARVVPRAERDRIYAIQGWRFPCFAEYEVKASRVIPVVELVID